MQYLKNEYEYGNWKFKDNSDICTEYIVENVTDASSSNTIESENKIKKIIEKIRPTQKEIELNEYIGAYSSFNNSPAQKGILQFDM